MLKKTSQKISPLCYRRNRKLPTQLCAGGVVFRFENGRPLLALVRERGHDLAILPKGRVEAGESLEDAARREIEEEAGLSKLHLMGDLGLRERRNYRGDVWKEVHYFLFAASMTQGRPLDRRHHYSLLWADPESLPGMLWPEQKELVLLALDRIMELRENAFKLREDSREGR